MNSMKKSLLMVGALVILNLTASRVFAQVQDTTQKTTTTTTTQPLHLQPMEQVMW
jgi:CHASE3 domain sensor protein